MPDRVLVASFLAALAVCAPRSSAQCTNAWESFGTRPGVGAPVGAVTAWDPDGPGPLTTRIAVGGSFSSAGSSAAHVVASWDPLTGEWSTVGAGPTGLTRVNALIALPNGDLVAGGGYPSTPAHTGMLLRWDGTRWNPFGGLTTPYAGVAALARMPNGDLAVGGHFTAAGAQSLRHVGIWNGGSWRSLGGGTDGPVLGLEVLPNGDLLALGEFTTAGGVPAHGVARWNGTTWSALGSGITGSVSGTGPRATAAVAMPNGDVLVGGTFSHAGGVPASHLARWDGVSWSAIGGGVIASGYAGIGVRDLAVLGNGDLVVAGFFAGAGGVFVPNIARWDGAAWWSLGSGIPVGAVNSLVLLPGAGLVAGGTFEVAGDVGASFVARWDGVAWSSLGKGTAPSDDVRSLLTIADGSVVAAGAFRAAGDVAAHGIARWDGATWSALGGGFPQLRGINAMARHPGGDLIVGGNGIVSRWNGVAWTHLPSAMQGSVPHADGVEALAVLPNGDLVVGGDFSTIDSQRIMGLARWDGTAWSMLGGQTAGEIHAMATLENGDLVVGGGTWMPHPQANNIARWDGTAWSPLGAGLGDISSEVFVIAPLPGGGLIAGGRFVTAGGRPANFIAHWDGSSWSPLGAGLNNTVRALHVLPNGDVLAAGYFTQAGGAPAAGIARWDGSSWSAVGAGVTKSHPGILAIAPAPDGSLLLGGGFHAVGGQPSPNLVRLTTSCPATVSEVGAGCGGAALTAGRPWLGGSWRAEASGLPTAANVLAITGFATHSLPLSTVFPRALPGCVLRVQPDFVDLRITSNGTASLQIGVPEVAALVGLEFWHQMVAIEVGTAVVTATNGLGMRVGAL